MSQLYEKSNQILGVKQRPSCSGANACSVLQNRYALPRKLVKSRIHIRRFEQNVMYAFAVRLEELSISARSFQRLNQL